jgi:hypothetical protein
MAHRYPLAALVAAMLIPAVAIAGIPSPSNSTVPTYIVGSPDGGITATIIVRDVANNPCAGSSVVLDFSASCSTFRPCASACTFCTTDLTAHTVRKLTDPTGTVTFDLRVGDSGCANPPYLRIYADGLLLRNNTAFASVDQDGDYSVTSADAAILAGRLGSTDLRSDFDGDGVVTAADQAILGQHFGSSCEGVVGARISTWGALKSIYR